MLDPELDAEVTEKGAAGATAGAAAGAIRDVCDARDALDAFDARDARGGDLLDSADSLFARGLPRGQMLECICKGASVGGQSLMECLLRAPWESGVFNALIDTGRGLDPESLCRGLSTRLLWVPVGGVQALIQALDLLLRDENFSLVVADLRGLGKRDLAGIQAFVWYRLQRLVHQRQGGCLLLTEQASVRCADRRLRLDRPRRLADLDERRVDLLAAVEASARFRNRGQLYDGQEGDGQSGRNEHQGRGEPGVRAVG